MGKGIMGFLKVFNVKFAENVTVQYHDVYTNCLGVFILVLCYICYTKCNHSLIPICTCA